MIEGLSEKDTMSSDLNTCCSWRQRPGKEKNNNFKTVCVFNNSKVNLQHLYIRNMIFFFWHFCLYYDRTVLCRHAAYKAICADDYILLIVGGEGDNKLRYEIKHPKMKLKTKRLQYLFVEVKYNSVCGGVWGQKHIALYVKNEGILILT